MINSKLYDDKDYISINSTMMIKTIIPIPQLIKSRPIFLT